MGYTYFRVTDERARDVMPKATEIIKDIFKTFPEVSKSLKGSDVYFMSHENDNGKIIPAEKNWVKARRLYNKYCRTHNMKIPNYSKWNIDE